MRSYLGGCAIGDCVGRGYCVERYVSQLTVGSFDSDSRGSLGLCNEGSGGLWCDGVECR